MERLRQHNPEVADNRVADAGRDFCRDIEGVGAALVGALMSAMPTGWEARGLPLQELETSMNAQRMYKEARPLFWPWCAVVVAGALPLLHPPSPLYEIGRLGFLLGIPLFAALPFGNEFQNRTFSLLLSQPISRMEIWREKLSITAIVVFTAALVFLSFWRASGVHGGRGFLGYAAGAAIVLVASAPFWTLFTRSTVGGLFLRFWGLQFRRSSGVFGSCTGKLDTVCRQTRPLFRQ